MHKIRELIRLIFLKELSNRRIAESLKVSHNTVGRYRNTIEQQKITSALIAELNDTQLVSLFNPTRKKMCDSLSIDWESIHTELQTKGVTLQLLWEEYRASQLTVPSYSHFTRLYKQWSKKLNITMRQAHRAGEKMFVDFSGKTVPIHLPSGEILDAQIFVAVLGASGYTYVEALRSQVKRDWNETHVNAFNYFGGVPAIVVPDNLKSAVIRNGRHGVKLNDSYLNLARHYQTAIIPTRPRKPRDKAKVEGAVLLVQRWILARLRHFTFFSIEELNVQMQRLLTDFNHRQFKKRSGSRRSLFEQIDAPALKALPETPYEYSEWRINVKVGMDCTVEHERHYYSVPYALVGKQVDLNITSHTVEVFHKNQRVTSHQRSFDIGESTMIKAHLPDSHRHYQEWNPRRLLVWTQSIGQAAEMVFKMHLDKPNSELAMRTCSALVEEAKLFGYARFESACERALAINSPTLVSIRSILHRNMDQHAHIPANNIFKLPLHQNVRGAHYFAEK
ncbi:MAG: IS21 family transposase [Methylotenera sp.]|nr:IS21 family transposase [Methylotenera sp.]